MDSPEKKQNNTMPLPDSFGTGRQPEKQKSYRAVTLILLIFLVAANLVTIAIYFRLQNEDKTVHVRDAFLPGNEQLGVLAPILGGNLMQSEADPSGQSFPLDLQITEISDVQRRYWELPEGVMISWLLPNGKAYLAGVRDGDLLLQVDAWRIKTAQDYQKTIEHLHPGDTVQLLIYRMGQEYSIAIEVPEDR